MDAALTFHTRSLISVVVDAIAGYDVSAPGLTPCSVITYLSSSLRKRAKPYRDLLTRLHRAAARCTTRDTRHAFCARAACVCAVTLSGGCLLTLAFPDLCCRPHQSVWLACCVARGVRASLPVGQELGTAGLLRGRSRPRGGWKGDAVRRGDGALPVRAAAVIHASGAAAAKADTARGSLGVFG